MTTLTPNSVPQSQAPSDLVQGAVLYRSLSAFIAVATCIMVAIVAITWSRVLSATPAFIGLAAWAGTLTTWVASTVVQPKEFPIVAGTIRARDIWFAEWEYTNQTGQVIDPLAISENRYDANTTVCWRDLRPTLVIASGGMAITGLVFAFIAYGYHS